MQIHSHGTSGILIVDDVTATKFVTSGNQQFVDKYVVGEPVTVNTGIVGYTRYTTSPNLPNWGVGTGAMSGSCGGVNPVTSAPIAVAIYSHTTGGTQPGTPETFYVCAFDTF